MKIDESIIDDEKKIAIIFEKYIYNKERGIIFFKPIKYIIDCEIDNAKGILTTKNGKTYYDISNKNYVYKNEKNYYGYPHILADFKELKYQNINEILKNYFNEVKDYFYISTPNSNLNDIINLVFIGDSFLKELYNEESLNDYFNDCSGINIGEEMFYYLSKNIMKNNKDIVSKIFDGAINLNPIEEIVISHSYFYELVRLVDNKELEAARYVINNTPDSKIYIRKGNTVIINENFLLSFYDAILENNYELAKAYLSCIRENGVPKVALNKQFYDKLYNSINDNNFLAMQVYITNIMNTLGINLGVSNENNQYLQSLNNLVGLDNIKEEIKQLIKYLKYRYNVEKVANLPNINLHMCFYGNAGTGKTTVARIIASILFEYGFIKRNVVSELTTGDLIAEYVGQTAVKTKKVLEENDGGVIFIDEAYSFVSETKNFSQDAIVEIIKEMEKHTTVFIFAGYKKEMKNFIEMNSGLASRIGYYFDFHDYSIDELYQIFLNKLHEYKLNFDETSKNDLLELLKNASSEKNFGNGRFIDKLIDQLIVNHAYNVEDEEDVNKLLTITSNDFSDDLIDKILYKSDEKHMGFFSNDDSKKLKKNISDKN